MAGITRVRSCSSPMTSAIPAAVSAPIPAAVAVSVPSTIAASRRVSGRHEDMRQQHGCGADEQGDERT